MIPHQTVLENVELALTLSGVSRKERRERATKALIKVGLGDKIKSKPNQLSGGQMQRVAIARALVNNPEIILADEPTGALDTKTSLQVMELLKEVSKERLVVMVTHNPDIAEKYSTRIIKIVDGKITDDSAPLSQDELAEYDSNIKEIQSKKEKIAKLSKKELRLHKKEQKKLQKEHKKSVKRMSFFTALSLSFKNLLTKKARTILVSFAGSIGIIGIALILSLSSGFNAYINTMQENTLSTYPITIKSKSIDFSEIVLSMFADTGEADKVEHQLDAVYAKENIAKMMDSVGDKLASNNLEKFYDYINEHKDELEPYVNSINFTYDLDFSYYTNNSILEFNDINEVNASDAVINMITIYALHYFKSKTGVEFEAHEDGSYTLINPTYDSENIVPPEQYAQKYPFIYTENNYTDLNPIVAGLENDGSILLNKQMVLFLVFRIIGLSTSNISALAGGSASMMFSTSLFSEMIDNQELIEAQYNLVGENSRWTRYGAEFTNEALLVLDKNNELDDYVLFGLGLLSNEQMSNIMDGLVNNNSVAQPISYDTVIGKTFKVLDRVDFYVNDTDDGIVDFRTYKGSNDTKYQNYYIHAIENCTNSVTIVGIVRPDQTTNAGSLASGVVYTKYFTQKMIEHRNTKLASFGESIEGLTSIDQEIPESIQIYINTFDSKKQVKRFIENYNDNADANDRITYSDTAGLIMSTVSTIINAITYVLIAFVSI